MNTNDAEKQQDLMNTLDQIQVGDILSIKFLITGGKSYTINTHYIKKLAFYICEKKGKKEFSPEELREIYEYVKKYLITDTEDNLRKVIEDVIGGFVRQGGMIEFLTEPEEEKLRKIGGNTYKSIIYRNLIPYVLGIIAMFIAFSQSYGSGEGFFMIMFIWGWLGCMILYFIYTVIMYLYRNREVLTVKRLVFEAIGFFIIYFLLLYYSFYFLEDFIGF